jgi:GAF domain-containing protein
LLLLVTLIPLFGARLSLILKSFGKSRLDNHLLLSTLIKVHSKRLKNEPPQEVFSFLLENLLLLTNSEYGFIGDVVRKEGSKPYLKTWAITDIAWSKETKKLYDESYEKGLEFKNLDNLFGFVIKQNTSIISNDPKTDSRAGNRIPQGHPPLNCFLGLPIRYNDELIGTVGIANRPGGYSKEIIKYLEPFMVTVGSLLVANRRIT